MGASSSSEAARHHAPREKDGWCTRGSGRERHLHQERRHFEGANTTSKIKERERGRGPLGNNTRGKSKTLEPMKQYTHSHRKMVPLEGGFVTERLTNSNDNVSRGQNGHTLGKYAKSSGRKGSLTATDEELDGSSHCEDDLEGNFCRRNSSDCLTSSRSFSSDCSSDGCCSGCSCLEDDLGIIRRSPSCSPHSRHRMPSKVRDFHDAQTEGHDIMASGHSRENIKDQWNANILKSSGEVPDTQSDLLQRMKDTYNKMNSESKENEQTFSTTSRFSARSSNNSQSQTHSLPVFRSRAGAGNHGNLSVYRNPKGEFATSKKRQRGRSVHKPSLSQKMDEAVNLEFKEKDPKENPFERDHDLTEFKEKHLENPLFEVDGEKSYDPTSISLMSPRKLSAQYRDDASEFREVFGRIRQLRSNNDEEAFLRGALGRGRSDIFKTTEDVNDGGRIDRNNTNRQRSGEEKEQVRYANLEDLDMKRHQLRETSGNRKEDSLRSRSNRSKAIGSRSDRRQRMRSNILSESCDESTNDNENGNPSTIIDNARHQSPDARSLKHRKNSRYSFDLSLRSSSGNHNDRSVLESYSESNIKIVDDGTRDRRRSKTDVNDDMSDYRSFRNDQQDHYRRDRDRLHRVEGHARDKGGRERHLNRGRLEKVLEERDLLQEECTVPYVLAYDDLLSGSFKAFVDCSNQIGGDVAEITKLVQGTFINQRAFLVMASKSQRPLDCELPQVLEPTGKKIQEVIGYRESKRQSPFFNHLSAISESIPGLSWVAVAPAPGPYVKEMGDSAVFYTNRVLKEYREKDKLHVEWVQTWNNVFKELQSYVLAHHTTGLSWNTRGGNAMNNLKPAPANCGVPPPPPPGIPPPPPMMKLEPKAIPGGADDGRAALFESINKGTDITSGLKKMDRSKPRPPPRTDLGKQKIVTDEMKTHKNPSLREGPKPFVKASSGATQNFSKEPSPPSNPPKLTLEGKKWIVEFHKDKPNLLISQTRMDQCVYIYKCVNTVVQVKGKINNVILDSCKKSSVVFDNLVSSAEVVNCQGCQVQVMGVMPTLSIEKTDGCQVYLSKESLNTEVISAKSTAMNVLIPNDDGDFTECPIPEQFKTVIKGLSLSTSCTEAAG